MSENVKLTNSVLKSYEGEDGSLYIYGSPLVPEVTDHQGDIISADEIKKSCRDYMIRSQVSGIRHKTMLSKQDVQLTQCFLAPCDFELEGAKFSKGSMVTEYRIPPESEELQKSVRDGTFNGFSIGGKAGETEIEEVPVVSE
jgi:hypothetical protein